jgi:hypothetical protein
MRDYVRALLGPVGRKNSWQLAEYAGHHTPDGPKRLPNGATWNADDVRDVLQTYVAERLGEDGGVLILDNTGFVKKGTTSAGVQRQHSDTADRTENCQIGVFAAYATTRRRALVDRELHLPKSSTDDRQRCRTAKIPDERTFATKGELAKVIVLRALASPLPIAWVTEDYGGRGDRRGGRVPRQRRLPLRERHRLPGGRRDLGRVRDTAVRRAGRSTSVAAPSVREGKVPLWTWRPLGGTRTRGMRATAWADGALRPPSPAVSTTAAVTPPATSTRAPAMRPTTRPRRRLLPPGGCGACTCSVQVVPSHHRCPAGPSGSAGEDRHSGGSRPPGQRPAVTGHVDDTFNGLRVPVLRGWRGTSTKTGAGLGYGTVYHCPAVPADYCLPGGAYTRVIAHPGDLTLKELAQAEIGEVAQSTYGTNTSGRKDYGGITGHHRTSPDRRGGCDGRGPEGVRNCCRLTVLECALVSVSECWRWQPGVRAGFRSMGTGVCLPNA